MTSPDLFMSDQPLYAEHSSAALRLPPGVPSRPAHPLTADTVQSQTHGDVQTRNLFQWVQHQEHSGLTSHRRSPKCWKCFQVCRRKMWDRGRWVQAGGQKRSDRSLSWGHSWGLASSGQSLWLEGVVLVSIKGCFALWVFCMSQETNWNEEPNEKVWSQYGGSQSPLLPWEATGFHKGERHN